MRWVVFDIDGVLIDVTQSFDKTVKRTFEFLSDKSDFDISLEVIRVLRKRGVFGDDFKLTEAILRGSREFNSAEMMLDKFRENGDIRWVRNNWEEGVDEDELITVFNTFYLGEKYEERLFDFEGFWREERSIIDLKLLERVDDLFRVGAVTGRDRSELRLAKDILGYEFEEYITRDDYLKPNPKALKVLVGEEKGFLVGDALSDRQLVQNYNSHYEGSFRFIEIGEDVKTVNEFLKKIIRE
ncbi:MAG: hydrolase [Candidatus Thermoplasmatota archaeon]|nr:hydrolase [Candidatus Thermoplasmatota archaeon]MBS3789969.1 hydrolase [Candidatus Thermoplasmatota archaeon]